MAKHGQNGFTLVELLVCIVVGSLVTLAATTVLLLGLRINGQSTGAVTRQNTTRILLTALEDVVKEGAITNIQSGPDAWSIYGDMGDITADDVVVFSYDSEKQAIYTGDPVEGTPLLENVYSSFVSMDGNQLLTITVETKDGTYSTSAYCRQAISVEQTDTKGDVVIGELTDSNEQNDNTNLSTEQSRLAFLKILASQYRIKMDGEEYVNRGFIVDPQTGMVTTQEHKYYSQWYIKGGWGKNGWGPDTPWCACFVTWGIYEATKQGYTDYIEPPEGESASAVNDRPSFAGVDSFMEFFLEDSTDRNGWMWSRSVADQSENVTFGDPEPGDIVFFDWERNGVLNITPDPDHVGVVLMIQKEGVVDYLYTIEGNTSNMVAVRKYKLTDPRILGYGVLDWAS